MDNNERIVYSLNVADIQNVAEGSLGRPLTDHELKLVEDNLGDYIPWFDSIEMAISSQAIRGSTEASISDIQVD